MKQILLSCIAFCWFSICLTSTVSAQGVGINSSGNPPHPSAALDVNLTGKGTLISRLTTAERDAITNPAQSLMIYNLTTKCFEVWENGLWQTVWCAVCPAPAQPGAISGNTSPCEGTSQSYSVTNVTGITYTWTFPAGWSQTTGGTSNSVTVTVGSGSGNIQVTPSNIYCGNGPAQTLAVTSTAIPAAPSGGTHTPSQTQVVWNWNTVSGATGYKYNTVNNYNTATDNGNNASYTQTGLNCNTSYTLYVWAYSLCGGSASPVVLTQSTSSCCIAVISLDATSYSPGSGGASNTFSISTTNANEMILVFANGYLNGYGVFNGSITVDGNATTEVSTITGPFTDMALYGYVAPSAGSHTIVLTWGSNWYPGYNLAYAASFTGFCGTPTVAANVQGANGMGTTSVSVSITPAAANSCLFGDYFINNNSPGTVTWTNNNLIRTDHISYFDGSIANVQLTGTSPVTVTATDSSPSSNANGTVMILAVVHP